MISLIPDRICAFKVTLEMMGESKARTVSPRDGYFQSLDCGLAQIARDHATFGMIHAYVFSPYP